MPIRLDLAALAANYALLCEKAQGASCAAVLKANAYGLGVANIAPVLAKAGCSTFFVAHASEGAALRALLPEATIIVLHGVKASDVPLFRSHNLIPVLNNPSDLAAWQGPAWLHVDTGMHRLGFSVEALPQRDNLLGVMSHLACADEPQHFMNVEQLRAFRDLRAAYSGLPLSLAASSGIFLGAPYLFNLVRPGIALYGGNPTPEQHNPMAPVVQVHCPILQVHTLDVGQTVGYGATWMAERPTRLATIEAGYADGLLRSLSGHGIAAIDGQKVRMVGRLSMDLIVLDVTDIAPVSVGQAVELIGPTITVDDVARAANTLSYEVLTSLKVRA